MKMTVIEEMQSAIKSNNVVIGYNESLKYIKANSPQTIIVVNNMPISERKELEHNSKISKIRFEVFEGTSRELGVVCGKPFPVTTIAIK